MNFEKVELFGFKSFADKAEINFGEGVTCIVGPNGCGKSNVADAIRWVLGEQSAKALRGGNMQDVIFNGTDSRKKLSYCEVSLFFDNSEHIFSLDYNEVIFTRKLYRSGESEYYINKQPARLRDMVNLLREVGVGRDGYTIIGQGKVSELLNAKPEDRRVIFEEATGISKFKASKNENERKLERTRENLTRYSDIMSVIESRLGPLEKQANKAREYNELTADLKRHELNVYISKVESVGADKDKINTRIKAIDEQTELRNSELSSAKSSLESLMQELSNIDQTLNRLNRLYTEKRVAAEQKAGKNNLVKERIANIERDISEANDRKQKVLALIEKDKQEIANAENQISENEKILKELIAKDEALSLEIVSLNEKIAIGESIERESNKKMLSSLESLSDYKFKKGSEDAELNAYIERLSELEEKITQLTNKYEVVLGDIATSTKNSENLVEKTENLKGEVVKTETEVRSANEKVAVIDNKIYGMNSTLSTLKTRETFYRAYKENHEGYNQSVQNLFKHAKSNKEVASKMKGLVAEIISCDKKFDIAIEIALAASAQNIVVQTPDDAKFLIEYLKKNDLGRLTFLPISAVKPRIKLKEVIDAEKENGAFGEATEIVKYAPEFSNIISSLLGNTLVVDNIDNATKIAKKYAFAFKIVTLDGDLINPQGSMSGGSRRVNAGILSNDRRLEEVANELKKANAEMDKLTAEKCAEESKRDELLKKLEEINALLWQSKQDKVVEDQKIDAFKQSLNTIETEINDTNGVIKVINSKIDELHKKSKATEIDAEQIEKDKEKLSDQAEKNSLVAESLKKKKDEILSTQTGIKIDITETKNSITAKKSDIENYKNEINLSKHTASELDEIVKEKLLAIDDLKKQMALIAMSKEERDEIKKIEDEINATEKRSGELKGELNAKNDTIAELQKEIIELTDKRGNQVAALAKVDSDLEHLQQSVWEDYQETYETAQKVREEDYDAKFGEAEIQRIRKRRNFLGEINANALDDYKEEKAKFEEMQLQKKDLEDAEADIQSALNTIKEEMVAQFDEGFRKINENFGKIFKELFGGGRASLELDYTNATDKLEAGIEIKVEPPGKKLSKLSLYSGGEQALTAIAILFAILKLKPMAFCVLDEIEAALDEANVDRFARYLKKFSKETQFIVITHRKPTMELADALFGVTMEEKGVSKLVSVKLSDVVLDEE